MYRQDRDPANMATRLIWVLHPESMNGGPIKWVPTNGTYPHETLNI